MRRRTPPALSMSRLTEFREEDWPTPDGTYSASLNAWFTARDRHAQALGLEGDDLPGDVLAPCAEMPDEPWQEDVI